MKKQLTDREEAIASLRKMIRPGSKVYTIVGHVSSSGMTRHIQPFIVSKGQIISIGWYVARATGRSLVKGSHAIKSHGCGMDMCFELVYALGRSMYPNGFKLPKGKAGRNGDESGFDKDGGYAFRNEHL